MKSKRRVFVLGIAAIVLGALLLLRHPILYGLGELLVKAGPPVQSDMVVVIGGDYLGNRILKGAELVREGYAPAVLASGSGNIYGHLESELEVDFAVAHGYSREMFHAVHFPALSTTDEARADVAQLRRLGVRRYILVTSPFHTARAGRVFRRTANDLEVHVVAAPDPYWAGGRWWTKREGQKEWFFEAVKNLADFIRL